MPQGGGKTAIVDESADTTHHMPLLALEQPQNPHLIAYPKALQMYQRALQPPRHRAAASGGAPELHHLEPEAAGYFAPQSDVMLIFGIGTERMRVLGRRTILADHII